MPGMASVFLSDLARLLRTLQPNSNAVTGARSSRTARIRFLTSTTWAGESSAILGFGSASAGVPLIRAFQVVTVVVPRMAGAVDVTGTGGAVAVSARRFISSTT